MTDTDYTQTFLGQTTSAGAVVVCPNCGRHGAADGSGAVVHVHGLRRWLSVNLDWCWTKAAAGADLTLLCHALDLDLNDVFIDNGGSELAA